MATNSEKITIEPLDVDNYGEWRNQMKSYLTFLGLYEAIEKPNSEEGKKNDAKCRALIILKLKTFHHPEVEDLKTAKEVWDELETLYKKVSNSRIAQLKIALQGLKMEGGERVVKYVARTRAIASELRAAGKPVDEVDLAINVLNGLPAEFKTLRTILLNGSDELKLSVIQSKLIEHEQALDLNEEKEAETDKDTSMAFAARHQQSFRKFGRADGKESGERSCFGCGKPGHIQKRCRTTGPECYKCGERGHLERECKKESSGSRAFRSMVFTVLEDETKSAEWILDSGSRVHVCNDMKKFENFKPAESGDDKLFGIAGEVKVHGWGSVKVECKLPEGEANEILLKRVAFVPTARANLMSQSGLTRKGVSLQVDKSGLSAEFEGELLLTAKQRGGLFVVDQAVKQAKQAVTEPMVPSKKEEVVQAKGRDVLDVLHLHVSDGEKKLVTLVDDVSELSVMVPIEKATDVGKVVPILVDKLERQSWKKVKSIAVEGESVLTDEAKEFCNSKKINLLKERTGPAGRRCQELLARGEEILNESKLPKSFWGDAVLLANQMINREKSEGTRSAWEKFDGKQTWEVKHKLGEKVEFSVGGGSGIFLGYAGQDGKVFKILRLKDKKVFVTKSVEFQPKPKMKPQTSSEDLAEELEEEQLKSEEETPQTVGATGGVRRSERERKPPERLSLFATVDPY